MLGIFGNGRKNRPAEDVDTVSVLEVKNHGESVRLTAKFEGKTWKELLKFAKEKGYVKREELLSLLFSYGVSEREGVDIEKRHSEMFVLGGKYSSMKFQAYELFTDNRALTLKLSTMLPDNRKLRRLAEEEGLMTEKKEEWDGWDQEKVDGFYKKYVFIK
ncbi:MAG: hypothetical protein JRM82_04155 [Nitrososphaerota archaeon]|nr:hypothetical protein [Nitrososphaerota archaeon]